MSGTIHRISKNKTRNEARMTFLETMAMPALLCDNKTQVPTERIQRRIQNAEMILRKIKGCRKLDHIKNGDIRSKLAIQCINEKIQDYRNN